MKYPSIELQGVWSQKNVSYEAIAESQSILISQTQLPQLGENALDQAIRSIGGLVQLAEERLQMNERRRININ